MAEFADRMKSFTDQLRDSIQVRGEALSQVHTVTGELLEGARTFLGNVADEHRARAEELHATLATHRKDCQQKVAEMRESHQESLQKMRGDLHHLLSETRKTREDAVHQMSQTFQLARQELAQDLREASNAWHEFAADRATRPAATARKHATKATSRGAGHGHSKAEPPVQKTSGKAHETPTHAADHSDGAKATKRHSSTHHAASD